MDLPRLLTALAVDQALPWGTAARECGLPPEPDAPTRRILEGQGLVVVDLDAKRTAGARRLAGVTVICRDAAVAQYEWYTLVQVLGLAAGRRELGVGAAPHHWESHPQRNVEQDRNGRNRFMGGAYGDGRWDEYGPDGFIRSWLLEYASGEQVGKRLDDKLRAYGRQPQVWFTDSTAHARAIRRAARRVLPSYEHVKVEVVSWPGDDMRGADGPSTPAPTKEDDMTTQNEATTIPTELAEAPVCEPLDLLTFLNGGELLEPGAVAQALGVKVPRVAQMARDLDDLLRPLGVTLPQVGKDRRFSQRVVGVLRCAQARSRMGVRFTDALRAELVTLGVLSGEEQAGVPSVLARQAEQQVLMTAQEAQRVIAEFDARAGEVLRAFEERILVGGGAVRRQEDLLPQFAQVVQNALSLIEVLARVNREAQGTIDEARRYLPRERDRRQALTLVALVMCGAVLGVAIDHGVVWVIRHWLG